MFITNETAANDPIMQQAMASYMQRLQQEEARRQAIRDAVAAGTYEPVPYGTWNISDRH